MAYVLSESTTCRLEGSTSAIIANLIRPIKATQSFRLRSFYRMISLVSGSGLSLGRVFPHMQRPRSFSGAAIIFLPTKLIDSTWHLGREADMTQSSHILALLVCICKFLVLSSVPSSSFGTRLDFSIFTVGEWPLRVFSTLKSLHIVPMNADSSVFAMLRLCGPLSLWFPSPPLLLGLTSTCKYALSCLVSPLVIAYLADIVSEAIHTALAASIRTLVAKPDEPDLLSLDAYYSVPTTSVPGIGMQVSAKRRFYGPKTILGCFELSFPAIHRVLWQYLGLPSEIQFRLTPYNEDDLAAASLQRYNAHISSNMNRPPSRRVADNAIRHAAVQEILTEAGVNARDERINISEWARAMTIVLSPSNSTATPDPEDLFGPGTNTGAFEINTSETYEPVAWDGLTTDLHSPPPISFSPFAPITSTAPEEVQNLPHAAANGTQHLDGEISDAQDESHIEAPVVPLQRLLEPADLDTGQSLRPISPPGTPQPGIERAPPLSRASLRPVRRPTEIDDGLDAISDRVNTMKYLKDMLDEPKDPVQHRVTALSNWPVDVLALHGSTLLTSMLMLPVEILITRMIARTYLTNRAGVGTHIVGEGSLARAIWPVSKTLFPGIGLSAGLTLAGSTLAMFAMQGLVGSVIWSLSTRVAIYVGRHCYGWGRF